MNVENISFAQRHGDTDTRRADRSMMIEQISRLTLEMLGLSFNELS